MIREAQLFEKKENLNVVCYLCHHRCRIAPSRRGICGVRENRDGTLYSLVYGRVIAENVDPIEKKPLFHLFPASRSYSIATMGCNFKCDFCQNFSISQLPRETGEIMGRFVSPELIVERALSSDSKTIAYTYTEPTIFFEYAIDIARLAKRKGIKNVFVTNGYMTEETLEAMSGLVDAANVDLKSFREDFYRKYCGAHLGPVLTSLKKMKDLGIWVEVTTLVIPGLNDDMEELREIARFVYSLGPETPWHISRFHPQYRMTDRIPTPADVIFQAREAGLDTGLKYVYVGNLPAGEGENTYCPNCKRLLIGRRGFSVWRYDLEGNRCPACRYIVEGIF